MREIIKKIREKANELVRVFEENDYYLDTYCRFGIHSCSECIFYDTKNGNCAYDEIQKAIRHLKVAFEIIHKNIGIGALDGKK